MVSRLSHAYTADERPSVLARRGLADEVYIRRDADHEQKERCEAPVLRMGHGVKFPCRPSHARRGKAGQA